jgi:hypothetical protein
MNNDLYALCLIGCGGGLFLGCFLLAFDPLPMKLLGGGILLATAIFATAAVQIHRRQR